MKLNKWLVNDITAQAYKDGKADGRAEAFDEAINIALGNYHTKISAYELEQLKSQN